MMSHPFPPSAAEQNPERATTGAPKPIHPSRLEIAQRHRFAQRLAVLIARIRQAQPEDGVNER